MQYLPKLEKEREKTQKLREAQFFGNERDSLRSGSYANLEEAFRRQLARVEEEQTDRTGSGQSYGFQLLKRGTFPICVRFKKWQKSNVGDYIEFQIQVVF